MKKVTLIEDFFKINPPTIIEISLEQMEENNKRLAEFRRELKIKLAKS